MTKIAAVLCGLVCLTAAHPVLADEDELAPGFDACLDAAESDGQVEKCLQSAQKYWDGVLARSLSTAVKSCDEGAVDAAACRQSLDQAQRAWLEFRRNMAAAATLRGEGVEGRINALGFTVGETRKQAELMVEFADQEE